KRVEIHEMSMQNDVMKMRQLEGGLEIPAGGKVELKSGGYHLMFIQPEKPYKEGETVSVTLEFEKAGKVTIDFPVTAKSGQKDEDHSGHVSMVRPERTLPASIQCAVRAECNDARSRS